jgi:exosortase A
MLSSQTCELGSRAEPVTKSKTWLLAGFLCLAVLTLQPFVFFGTSSALVRAWNGATAYNYCFLILPISAYLVWERRDRLLATSPKPSVLGFWLLFVSGAVWLLGELSGTLVVSEFALVAMAQSIVIAVLGVQATCTIVFPLCYLFFLVPAGESLIPGLQTVTANSAVVLLKLTGIPVRSDGLMIYLPNATWIVAEACAGLKFLIASVAVGALLSGMFLRSWRRRVLFMGLSVVVPVIANGFRAFIIVVISYLTNNQYAAGVDHILYGWVLFALVLLGMIGIAVAMREADGDEAPPGVHIQPRVRSPVAISSRSFAIAALCSLILAASFRTGASALAALSTNTDVPIALPLSVQEPWRPIATKDRMPPVFSGADRVWHQAYSDAAATIYLSLGYFASERPGAEIASSRHRFTSAAEILQTGEHWQDAGVAQGKFYVRALTFGTERDRRLLWYWLWVDGRYTGNPYWGKLLQLKVKLFGGPSAAAIISVSTDYTGDEESARGALTRFMHSVGGINSTAKTVQDIR